jgi:hypothetical protein
MPRSGMVAESKDPVLRCVESGLAGSSLKTRAPSVHWVPGAPFLASFARSGIYELQLRCLLPLLPQQLLQHPNPFVHMLLF